MKLPTSLFGPRIRLELTESRHQHQLWIMLQRDRLAGGKLYHWVECEADVARYITEKSDLNIHEFDYLIIRDPNIIGSFHIHSLNLSEREAELGYALEKTQEGNGYASEALRLVETELQRQGISKLWIKCEAQNHRSARLALRNGFEPSPTSEKDRLEFKKLI